ncbi:MAG: ABC transporter substrate-binding protein [Sedimentisphaerales bacterium]
MTRLAKVIFGIGFIGLIVLFIISGCGKKPAAGNRKIILQLNWIPDPTFTGEYIALKNMYWSKDCGLDVTIKPGGIGIDPIALVVSKQAQFAIVGADKAIIARANGQKIKVIAVDFQRNPVGWIARKSLGIKTFKDIPSNTNVLLGDKVGTETTSILNLCLKRLNLDKQVSPKGVGFDFSYFVQNKDVIYPVYLNEEPVRAKINNIEITEIDPSDPENGGVRLYGNVIIVNEEFLDENPKAVSCFVKGLRKGWEFAKKDPIEAQKIISNSFTYDKAALQDVIERSIDFATNMYGQHVPPCHMELREWENTINTLRESGILTKTITVTDLVELDIGSNI